MRRLIAPPKVPDAARRLYAAIVAAARQREPYESLGVPDTFDGRFDMLALHLFVALRRLRDGGERARELAQWLVDLAVDDFDVNLRELGAGDLGVPKRVRAMAQGLYGRIAAYDDACAAGDDALAAALRRNLFAGADAPRLAGMVAYLNHARQRWHAIPVERLVDGYCPDPGNLGAGGQ